MLRHGKRLHLVQPDPDPLESLTALNPPSIGDLTPLNSPGLRGPTALNGPGLKGLAFREQPRSSQAGPRALARDPLGGPADARTHSGGTVDPAVAAVTAVGVLGILGATRLVQVLTRKRPPVVPVPGLGLRHLLPSSGPSSASPSTTQPGVWPGAAPPSRRTRRIPALTLVAQTLADAPRARREVQPPPHRP